VYRFHLMAQEGKNSSVPSFGRPWQTLRVSRGCQSERTLVRLYGTLSYTVDADEERRWTLQSLFGNLRLMAAVYSWTIRL
jgi:hypothetical protein